MCLLTTIMIITQGMPLAKLTEKDYLGLIDHTSDNQPSQYYIVVHEFASSDGDGEGEIKGVFTSKVAAALAMLNSTRAFWLNDLIGILEEEEMPYDEEAEELAKERRQPTSKAYNKYEEAADFSADSLESLGKEGLMKNLFTTSHTSPPTVYEIDEASLLAFFAKEGEAYDAPVYDAQGQRFTYTNGLDDTFIWKVEQVEEGTLLVQNAPHSFENEAMELPKKDSQKQAAECYVIVSNRTSNSGRGGANTKIRSVCFSREQAIEAFWQISTQDGAMIDQSVGESKFADASFYGGNDIMGYTLYLNDSNNTYQWMIKRLKVVG